MRMEASVKVIVYDEKLDGPAAGKLADTTPPSLAFITLHPLPVMLGGFQSDVMCMPRLMQLANSVWQPCALT